MGLCLSLWEISEGRACYLLLDLEITGLFFPWRLHSPGCCQGEAREEESYGLKNAATTAVTTWNEGSFVLRVLAPLDFVIPLVSHGALKVSLH